ncbi:diphosphomevalonate decarboxylase [Flavobacteriaceae bacterium MAR_2010_188]|nr:diphosphomevalonate decarboxylase [Flavobacteriaceae bacterium MAR_2010_188]
MNEERFVPKPYNYSIQNFRVSWESPSNIALVKYWGKKPNQLPENPSISFTLKHSKTITELSLSKKESSTDFDFDVFLDGEEQEDFKPKIQTFFERVLPYLPFLKDYKFRINTQNTFPHSSGIASSASGMSALALCLMSVEAELSEEEIFKDAFYEKASFLARLGSGSASRSIEGPMMVWGKHHAIEGSNDFYAVKYSNEIHPNFKNYQDTILLVDKGQKQVSSSVGHNLMFNHPFALERFEQANVNLSKIHQILQSGDLNAFIKLVESEALTLHAMMMTSLPYFILMKPNTLAIINEIWQYRKQQDSKICFTLDAGANVHILYPEVEKEKVLEFIKQELVAYCENGQFIADEIGNGAIHIN